MRRDRQFHTPIIGSRRYPAVPALLHGHGQDLTRSPKADLAAAASVVARVAVRGPASSALRAADPESYALVCEALATFDVRDRLREIAAPVRPAPRDHGSQTSLS